LSSEINRLEKIVKDFLEFARPAEPVPTDLQAAELLNEVADLIRAKCQKNGTRIRTEVDGQLPFRGDRGQLKQVLINLGHNAAESI
ncbi:hypothetical protein, partial [Klebsiella pneumoniae]|uniref:hypothetical protein n=1 Tax=Klebsiella pneumoniae TaxID=573 RepID=UPI00190F3AB2